MKAQEEGMDGFEALMHDTPEFVLGDVMSPLKRLLHDYQRIEAKVSSVIAGAFKFTYPTPSSVKDIDREILELEFEKYFLGKQKPFQAKPEDFLRLYHQLKPNSYD
jgi:5'-deoxynucleotidase YfbR-like HD superfamily hydrolase